MSDKLEPTGSDKLEFTGERFTPECVREIRYEHVHRYAFARDLVRGRVVLDAACGEGYGARLLATAAASVIGVDISATAVEHARNRYRLPNLTFEAADCRCLPFTDRSFDCVVSFETLEHLADQHSLLREFRRVLRPDGFLAISSPDKAVYSERLGNRNEYHVKELYRDELEALLRAHFPACRLWGQKLGFHSAIWSLEAAPGVGFRQETGGEIRQGFAPLQDPVYYIALCAATEAALPEAGAGLSLFDDAGESVYAHYYHEIRKNMAAGEVLAGHERELAALRAEMEAPGPRDEGSSDARSWWRRLLGIG